MIDQRWLKMRSERAEPHWPPPHGAEDWWNSRDDSVGTADFRSSSSFWEVRIRLQIMIADDVITAACCLVEDSEAADAETETATALAVLSFLKDKTLAEAITFDDRGAMWCPSMVADAVRTAIHDWAAKRGPERFARLPPLPPDSPPYRYPLWQRVLRRIPFFRGLGL